MSSARFAVAGLGQIAQHAVPPTFADTKEHANSIALVTGDNQTREIR